MKMLLLVLCALFTACSGDDSDGGANENTDADSNAHPGSCQFDYAPAQIEFSYWENDAWVLNRRESIIYNDAGYPTSWQFHDAPVAPSTEWILEATVWYTYDNAHRLTNIQICYDDVTPETDTDGSCTIASYVYLDDDSYPDQLIPPWRPDTPSEITYEDGRMVQISDDPMSAAKNTTFIYDENGRLVREDYDQSERVHWSYDENGYLVALSQEYFRNNDTWEESSWKTYTWENGRMVEINGENEFILEINYDADGRMDNSLSIDTTGNVPVNDSLSSFTYTDKGNSCFFELYQEQGMEFEPLAFDLLRFYGQGEINVFLTP